MQRFIFFKIFTFVAMIASSSTLFGYEYVKVDNDPWNARIYTLGNGLKVFLSVNKDEPRIQTYIAVKTGSKNDPSDVTGLAHYLEHMLFKGTSKIASADWAKEKPLLDRISELYETHKNEPNPAKKAEIYRQIDSLSFEAAKYAIPTEYDRMVSLLGAKGTNAFTSLDETVYVNDIPSNELERFLMLEGERFSELVLRLFHTELETVYEEFNRAQDNDDRKSYYGLMEGLFQKHTYGTQTTLGKGEHLKNPSMKSIHKYFDTYYVPNNMAICLAGDLDPDKTIQLVDRYFGNLKPGRPEQRTFPKESPLVRPIEKTVYGPKAEKVILGFRFPGASSEEALLLRIVDEMLSNGVAGLIDLNMVQEQKVLSANSWVYYNTDYNIHGFTAQNREGQSLEEVKDLLLAEIENLKTGNFDERLLSAAVNNIKLKQMRRLEKNNSRAYAFVENFIHGIEWKDFINREKRLEAFTKKDIIDFVNKHYSAGYVVVYKKTGADDSILKLEKPAITPLVLNKDRNSDFAEKFLSMPEQRIQPVFADFSKSIQTTKLKSGVELSYVPNTTNETFELVYLLDMGSDNDLLLSLAAEYLPYLGTSKYSAKQLKEEWYNLGLNLGVSTSRDNTYITLSGLESSLEEGIVLLEHLLADVKADLDVYKNLVEDIVKARKDSKLDKSKILWQAMFSYAKYGQDNPFTHRISEDELRKMNPEILEKKIKELSGYKHRVFYYGGKGQPTIKALLDKHHKVAPSLKAYPPAKQFKELEITQNQVLFVPYEMVQTELLFASRDQLWNIDNHAYASVFNEYFGRGLSSVVFQEIRESRALAYSAFAGYSSPNKKNEYHWVYGYIGTQTDKLGQAVEALHSLLNEIPMKDEAFRNSVSSSVKKIETSRTTGKSLFWARESAAKRGLTTEINQEVYQRIRNMEPEQMEDFFNKRVKGRPYYYLLIGNPKMIDQGLLESLGTMKTMTLEQLYGF